MWFTVGKFILSIRQIHKGHQATPSIVQFVFYTLVFLGNNVVYCWQIIIVHQANTQHQATPSMQLIFNCFVHQLFFFVYISHQFSLGQFSPRQLQGLVYEPAFFNDDPALSPVLGIFSMMSRAQNQHQSQAGWVVPYSYNFCSLCNCKWKVQSYIVFVCNFCKLAWWLD